MARARSPFFERHGRDCKTPPGSPVEADSPVAIEDRFVQHALQLVGATTIAQSDCPRPLCQIFARVDARAGLDGAIEVREVSAVLDRGAYADEGGIRRKRLRDGHRESYDRSRRQKRSAASLALERRSVGARQQDERDRRDDAEAGEEALNALHWLEANAIWRAPIAFAYHLTRLASGSFQMIRTMQSGVD